MLTSVHSPFDTRIFHKEAKSLLKAGYEIALVAQHDRDEIIDGIKILSLAKPRNRIERMTKTVWQVYHKALKVDADIYHFHDPELIPVGLLLKLYGKRVIYDVHEDVPKQILSKNHITNLFRKPISIFVGMIEAFSAKRFDGVVTATPFIDRKFAEFGANSVNVNNFPITSEFVTNNGRWEKKEKTVCYIGGITRSRGAYEMVEAISKTLYKLLLVGNIESGTKTKMMQSPGWRQVDALGFVDREGVRVTAMNSMAGLVLFHPKPNHIDAQPTKMFEYMSAGIPVIASNFPLWKKIVEETNCGICVDPMDPKKIGATINYLLTHAAEAKQMGKNGRQAVEKKFNWGKEEKKLIKVYEKLSQNL
jgi:hypothetical protein